MAAPAAERRRGYQPVEIFIYRRVLISPKWLLKLSTLNDYAEIVEGWMIRDYSKRNTLCMPHRNVKASRL